MTTFHFDTSGVVRVYTNVGEASGARKRDYRWTDLPPFVQGYVEALCRSMPLDAEGYTASFSDLHPETLERLREDCERFTSLYGEWPLPAHGAGFWEGRQKDKHSPEFPPLTLRLSDDGKVHFA